MGFVHECPECSGTPGGRAVPSVKQQRWPLALHGTDRGTCRRADVRRVERRHGQARIGWQVTAFQLCAQACLDTTLCCSEPLCHPSICQRGTRNCQRTSVRTGLPKQAAHTRVQHRDGCRRSCSHTQTCRHATRTCTGRESTTGAGRHTAQQAQARRQGQTNDTLAHWSSTPHTYG